MQAEPLDPPFQWSALVKVGDRCRKAGRARASPVRSWITRQLDRIAAGIVFSLPTIQAQPKSCTTSGGPRREPCVVCQALMKITRREALILCATPLLAQTRPWVAITMDDVRWQIIPENRRPWQRKPANSRTGCVTRAKTIRMLDGCYAAK